MIEKLSQKKWKYATIAVLGVLAIVITTPQATAATDNTQLVQQILNIVKNTVFGNAAIKTAVDSANTKLDALQTSVGDIDISNLDVAVSTRASKDTLELRSFNLVKAFRVDVESEVGGTFLCSAPFVIHSLRVITDSTNNADSFEVSILVLGDEASQTSHVYLEGSPGNTGEDFNYDLVQVVGVPLASGGGNRGMGVGVAQTAVDGDGDSLELALVISTSQSASCTLTPFTG